MPKIKEADYLATTLPEKFPNFNILANTAITIEDGSPAYLIRKVDIEIPEASKFALGAIETTLQWRYGVKQPGNANNEAVIEMLSEENLWLLLWRDIWKDGGYLDLPNIQVTGEPPQNVNPIPGQVPRFLKTLPYFAFFEVEQQTGSVIYNQFNPGNVRTEYTRISNQIPGIVERALSDLVYTEFQAETNDILIGRPETIKASKLFIDDQNGVITEENIWVFKVEVEESNGGAKETRSYIALKNGASSTLSIEPWSNETKENEPVR